MAGLFDASTTTMRQTATQVETETEKIRLDLQGLLTKLSALQGQWIGDGSTAFLSARTRYQDANVRLNQALVEIARLIKANETRYTADDAQASTALNTAVSDLSAGVASAGTRLSDLRAAIAPMVATWEGFAQQAYQAQQTKWDTAWNDLTTALTGLQTSTQRSNEDYSNGETANTAAWG